MRRNFLGVFVALLVGVACTGPDAARSEGKGPHVVATIGMIGDAVVNVAGDRATVATLMGTGVDPHLYKPTRTDISKLMKANIVFYNGLLLEGKMSDALIRVATSGKKVYPVTELLGKNYLLEPQEFAGHYDPHVWMDPLAWVKAVGVIRDKLVENDPKAAKIYRENAAKYIKEIQRLDRYAENVLEKVPPKSRVLVTAHDAFNYFGKRYGFDVVGIQGISTDSEAGVKDIENIVSLIVRRNISAVFVESTVSERNVRALIAGAKARGHHVQIGGTLFSDAMGNPGTYEGTYIGMIDHNLTIIARALGGQIPEKGMNAKLTLDSSGK